MIKYKLTDQNLKTHNGFKWRIGVTKFTNGIGGLCSPGFLHYYHHPLLAVFLNPIHANIKNPLLFEIEATGKHLDDNCLKGGCTEMTLIKEIELPVVSIIQRVAFGILCAMEVYKRENFIKWAENWLNGMDRGSANAANAAAYAADAAANAAANAANADNADNAADAAANAADAAANAADAAAYAANAAYAADYTADYIAAYDAKKELNLITIAEKAITIK